jgi:DNA uptake protein ComE-like DNA-binding protein
MTPRYIGFLFLVLLVVLGWSRFRTRTDTGDESAAYEAMCHGAPLHDIEDRARAMREGYYVHPSFSCITKASWDAVEQQKAEEAAARTPEAIARREAERQQRIAQEQLESERRAREREEERAQEEAARNASLEVVPVHLVEINAATESQLAEFVGAEAAAGILEERRNRAFRDWADVVHRVVALSAAQTAVRASLAGLTVNGRSLPGAEPPEIAR